MNVCIRCGRRGERGFVPIAYSNEKRVAETVVCASRKACQKRLIRLRGPADPRVQSPSAESYELRKTRALAQLRQSTWEATQYLTYDQVRAYVEGVLREVKSDEP